MKYVALKNPPVNKMIWWISLSSSLFLFICESQHADCYGENVLIKITTNRCLIIIIMMIIIVLCCREVGWWGSRWLRGYHSHLSSAHSSVFKWVFGVTFNQEGRFFSQQSKDYKRNAILSMDVLTSTNSEGLKMVIGHRLKCRYFTNTFRTVTWR